jgi:hypothetical protein
MTAEEQAKKIYNDILYHLEWDLGADNIHNKGLAKSCAYIAATQVINELTVVDFNNRFDFWQDVIKEIKNI